MVAGIKSDGVTGLDIQNGSRAQLAVNAGCVGAEVQLGLSAREPICGISMWLLSYSMVASFQGES